MVTIIVTGWLIIMILKQLTICFFMCFFRHDWLAIYSIKMAMIINALLLLGRYFYTNVIPVCTIHCVSLLFPPQQAFHPPVSGAVQNSSNAEILQPLVTGAIRRLNLSQLLSVGLGVEKTLIRPTVCYVGFLNKDSYILVCCVSNTGIQKGRSEEKYTICTAACCQCVTKNTFGP